MALDLNYTPEAERQGGSKLDLSYDESWKPQEPSKPTGIFDTFVEGAKSTGRALGATADTVTNDSEGVVQAAQAQRAAPKAEPLEKFHRDVAARAEEVGEDPGLWDSIKAVGGAAIDNPAGAGHAIVEQIPNSGPVLGGGWVGMKAGAALGTAIAPGVGTAVGGVVGGLAGMFAGNAAIETGHKAMEAADDGQFTPEERSQVVREGATKGAAVTAVDALTLGVSKWVTGAGRRAVESATQRALANAGVDIADRAAVMAARSDPVITTAVRSAQGEALKATETLTRRVARGGAALGLESFGEGLGEYLGELAATGKADTVDAVLEGMLSLGQSGAEVAWGAARNRAGENERMWSAPAGAPSDGAPPPVGAPITEGAANPTATWRNKDFDLPVEVIGQPESDQDGKLFVPVRGTIDGVTSTNYVPADELDGWSPDAGPSATPAAAKPSEQMGIDPTAGPMSKAAARAVDSRSTPVERERDFVPPPSGSFADMNEFASLLEDERADVVGARDRIAQTQDMRREFDLEEADRRTAEQMQHEGQARRRSVLDSILEDPETADPEQRFRAGLKRSGFRDAAPTEDEITTIQRFVAARDAVPAAPEIEPSAPNELDAEAVGIRERKPAPVFNQEGEAGIRPSEPVSKPLAPFTQAGAEKTAARWTQEKGEQYAVVPHPIAKDRFAVILARQAQASTAEAAAVAGADLQAQPREAGPAGIGGSTQTGDGAAATAKPVFPFATQEIAQARALEVSSGGRQFVAAPHPSVPGKFAVLPADTAQIGAERAPASGQVAPDLAGEKINRAWTAFADDSGSLGVPRSEMPQIKAEHRGAMTNFMNARGVQHQKDVVPADSLKPTQAEFSPSKVKRAQQYDGGDRSILVSADGYVLDGHHQWLAKREAGEAIKVIRLNAPIADLIPLAREFPSSTAAKGAAVSPTQAPTAPEQSTPAPGQRSEPAQTDSSTSGRRGAPDPQLTARATERADDLRSMAQDAGWAEEGGKLLRDADGSVTGRTNWIARAPWFASGMEARPDVLAQAVEDAVAGRFVRAKQRRTIEGMIEWLNAQAEGSAIDADSAYYDMAEAGYDDVSDNVKSVLDLYEEVSEAEGMAAMGFTQEEINEAVAASQRVEGQVRGTDAGRAEASERGGEGFELAPYSPQEIAEQESQRVAAETAEAKAVREAEEKRRADEMRAEVRRRSEAAADTFKLGQDAETNLSGQGGLFDATPARAEPQKATEPPAADAAQPAATPASLDRALQTLLDKTDGNGDPSGINGPENLVARTEIVSALTGRSVADLTADPRHKFITSVPQVEKLLHEAAGIEGDTLRDKRGAFVDWLDARTGQAAPGDAVGLVWPATGGDVADDGTPAVADAPLATDATATSRQPEASQESAQQRAASEQHSLPVDTQFRRGKGLARNAWIASHGKESSNPAPTIDKAAANLRLLLDTAQRSKTAADEHARTSVAVAAKIRAGEQPTDAELQRLFGLLPNQTYVRQPAAGWFVVEHLGVPRNRIRQNLGEAGGVVRSDSGVPYPIVYPRRLHKVFADAVSGRGTAEAPTGQAMQAEFVTAPDGSIDFGEITAEMGADALKSKLPEMERARPVVAPAARFSATNDRDTFTLERLNRDTNQMEPVEFRRGEMVKIAMGHPMAIGEIAGISHANRKFRLKSADLWYDFGYAYKAAYDEFASPRDEVDAILDNVQRRLDDSNAIEAEQLIQGAVDVAKSYNLGNYAWERMGELRKRAAVVVGEAQKRRAAEQRDRDDEAARRSEAEQADRPKDEPIKMTMAEWKSTHKDFKGTTNGQRTVLRGGRLVLVEIVSETPAPAPQISEPSATPTADRHESTMAAVRAGNATPEQFKESFESVVANADAIKAELSTKTKAELLREAGAFVQMRYANEKKGAVVDAAYREMLGEYALGETFSYGMARDSYQNALRRMVEATDADKLAQYARDRRAAIAEAQAKAVARAKAVENPQTLDEFRQAIAAKIQEGMEAREAFLTLTPEQRIKYDTLSAESTREAREQRKRANQSQVQAAGQTTGGQIIATQHTRDGYDLYVVQLADRLSREDYQKLLGTAKKMGGWYSSFRGNGATPGFQFKDRDNAAAFLKLAEGDTTAAASQIEQRRNAFEDDRSQSAVERLREMAERLEADANEQLSRDRKANTARRARFASAALDAAEGQKAMAQTMRRIAQAVEDGKTKFLDAVRTKTQIEALTSYVRTAKDNELRAKYAEYGEQQKRKGEPPTAETADFIEFPSYTVFRSDLASLGRQLLEVEGTKKLGQRLMSVADDVTDAYLEFARENVLRVSQFGRGDALAEFSSRADAERAIKRSGLSGKAIVLPIKRGQNRVVLSPSEAISRGVWTGDGDKRITLSAAFGAELVEAIGRRGNTKNRLTVPWQLQTAYDRRKALARIGVETASEFRSALREFIALQERAVANKAREMELQMVGRKADGLDFFPTPSDVADQMIEAADITHDMAVLEPSAGMGHIADRIRAAGAEPDVIEISPDRRELLEEKGYHLAEVDDFMDMEPRKFFTYGDVFRAPDGTEGIMRGSGGMGSQRVRLEDESGTRLGLYDRDELTGTAHRGTLSGYDRIIMNPPFSKRRDAEHVRHAYSLLKPGGRIVAIMGEGVFFGQDAKAQDFRDWLESVGGTSEKLPSGAFMDASLPVNTGVNARMVVIDRPSEAQRPPERPRTQDSQPDALQFSFAGQSAETADRHALATARRRIASGEDAEAVRRDTGWHRGADGMWRFEISDDQAQIKVGGNTAAEILDAAALDADTVRVGDVLDHPQLFAAYPHLEHIRVELMPAGEPAIARLMRDATGARMQVRGSIKRAAMPSVMLHELQHAIQGAEGFAEGGSRGALTSDLDKSGAETYRRLAGEVEARNTQSRQRMTPAQRRAVSPNDTADVPAGDVIVTFNGQPVTVAPSNAVATAPMTERGLVRALRLQFPGLVAPVESMLERGGRGQRGGLVMIDSADPLRIAGVFSKKTGRALDDSIELFSGGGKPKGFYDARSGLTFIFGPNVDAVTAPAVLLHEMVHGQQKQRIDRLARDMLMNRGTEPDADLRAFLDRVVERIVDADAVGDVREFAAYIVEQAVTEGRSRGYTMVDGRFFAWADSTLGKKMGDFLRSVAAMVRSWMIRHGGIKALTVDDLVGYAMVGVERAARGSVAGGKHVSASLSDPEVRALVEQYAGVDGAPSEAQLRDAVRQFRETERAYGGREGYDRAKSAGKTKLNYRQWVQVRTPNFMRWFGSHDIAAAIPARQAATFSDAREQAKAFQGRPLTNRATGIVATVSRNNLDKMLNSKAVGKSESPATHSLAVANLDALFEGALLGWSKPDSEGDPNIKAIHRFFTPVVVGGRAMLAKMTVKETVQESRANPLYTVEAVSFEKIENPAAQWVGEIAGADGVDPRTIRSAGLIQSMAERVQNFNPGEVSKVTDPGTGEPMVVFHGSRNGDITKFAPSTYFTEDASEAGDYATGHAVYPAYINIRRPYEASDDVDEENRSELTEIDEDYAEQLSTEGHDGVVARRNGETLWAIPFSQEHVKSAAGNVGTFDGASADIRFSRSGLATQGQTQVRTSDAFGDLSTDQRTFLDKVGTPPTRVRVSEWVKARADRIGTKIRQGLVDRYASLKELDEKLHGKDFIDTAITDSSWVMARMASSAAGAMSAMMNTGRIRFDAGQRVIAMQDGDQSGGLVAVLSQVGDPAEVERFMAWIAANRADKLMKEGREHLFTPDEIEAGKTLNTGRTGGGRGRAMVYAKAFREFQQYRDDVLAVAEATGAISAENRAMWKDEFYVPFYRVMDEEATKGAPRGSKGLSRQEAYKRLKGGSQNLNDLLENTLMNFHHLLTSGLKNQAAAQTIHNAKALGIARKVSDSERDPKTSTFVLEDGKRVFYEIDDPLVYEALTTLSDPGLNSTAVRVMSSFKRLFTNMTTVTPQFIVANLMRDLMQATATSPVSVFKNFGQGLKGYADEKTRAQMMASGGAFSFGHLYGADVDEVKASLARQMKGSQLISDPSMIPKAIKAGWNAWGKVTDSAENVSRAAVFQQNMDKGALRAAFEARDLMDFSSHGAWPAVRFLIRVVPFLNARLQGLDKIYRAGVKPSLLVAMGKGSASDRQAAARFAVVTGALTLATIALYLANADDDEYRKLEDWQKDTYWSFRIGGHMYHLPKPFEVGAIATMAERITEQFMDDKATGKLFRARMSDMFMQTFAFNPVPQLFQPVLDIYSNKDAFTKRDIESMSMERLSKGLRARDTTTAVAHAVSSMTRALGDDLPVALSPIQADHLIRGYFGAVGANVAALIDTAWRAANGETEPDKRWNEYQPIRRFYKDLGAPEPYTRYSTLFYEGLREAARVHADVRELRSLGRMDDASELMSDKRNILAMRVALERQQRRIGEINKQLVSVRRSDRDGAWKRREIDRLNTIKGAITERWGKRVEEVQAVG